MIIAKAEADRQSSLVAGAAAPQVVASLDIMLVRGVCLPPAQLEYSEYPLRSCDLASSAGQSGSRHAMPCHTIRCGVGLLPTVQSSVPVQSMRL